MSERLRIASRAVLLSALLTACCVELYHFLYFSARLASLLPTSDAHLFFSMGRGWLNGLVFYRDLFESKPPGIFLLAAIALTVGSYPFFVWLQASLLAMLPSALAINVYRVANGVGTVWLAVGIVTLFGLTMATIALYASVGFEAEGFGLLFSVLPALLLSAPTNRPLLMDVLAGLFLGCAAMLKEPFVASSLLAMMLFCRTKDDIGRVARILVVGGIVSLVILKFSGAFSAYFSIDLPEMLSGRGIEATIYPDFGRRIYFVIPSSVWVRILDVFKFFVALGSPAPAALLPSFILICLCLWAPLRADDLRRRSLITSTALIGCALLSGHHAFLLHQVLAGAKAVGIVVSWTNPLIIRLLSLTIGPPAMVAGAFLVVPGRLRPSRRVVSLSAVACSAMFAAAALVVGYGAQYGVRYGIFTFAPIVSLVCYCVCRLANRRQDALLMILAVILIVHIMMPGRFDPRFMQANVNRSQVVEPYPGIAAALDDLLTRCNVPRYMLASLALPPLSAFTAHSPYDIAYGQQRSVGGLGSIYKINKPNPYLAAKMAADAAQAQVIVAAPTDDPFAAQAPIADNQLSVLPMDARPGAPQSRILAPLVEVMQKDFTLTPPPCAQGGVPIAGVQVFFRKR